MALLTTSNIKDTYLKSWKKWVPAILEYAKGLKRKAIQEILLSLTTELGTCMCMTYIIFVWF